jgi:hypothetical protein
LEEGNTTQIRGRRRRVIIIFAVCVLVAIGVVAFWPGEREPEYNGKKLSEWLEFYENPGMAGQNWREREKEAEFAIRQIGTNALPWLMKWIQCDRPWWRARLINIADRFHVKTPSTAARILIGSAEMRANYAEGFGFQLVGPQAGPVIPDLVELMENTNSPVIASHAMYALANIANVTPPLIAMLTNDVSRVRCRAAYSLGSLGSGNYFFHDWVASNSAPFLLQTLRDPDLLVRKEATNAVRKIAPEMLTNGVKGF